MMSSSVETKTTSDKIRVLDKMNAEKIPYLLINMVVSEDKKTKKMNEIEAGWNTKSYEFLMETYNNKRSKNPSFYNAIFINLKKSPYMVADCDTEDGARRSKFNNKYGKCWRTKSCRKGLPHVWFKKHKDDKNGTKIGIEPEIDLVYEGIFENIHACFGNTKREMKTFDDFPTKTVIVPKKKKIVITSPKQIEETNFKIDTISNEEKDIIDNIDLRYINNYGDWLKIIWGIYSYTNDYTLCDFISKKGENYKNYADVVKHVNDDKKRNISWGTVCYYSRISNEEEFINIRTKYKPSFIEGNDNALANHFLDIIGDDLINVNNCIYFYKDPYWKQIKETSNLLCPIHDTLEVSVKLNIKKFNTLISTTTDEEQSEKYRKNKEGYKKLLNTIGSASKLKSIASIVVERIEESYCAIDNIKPYYFCFQDCAFDLISRKKIKVDKYDYISIHTGYNYSKPNPERVDEIKNIINQILPETEKKKCVLSVLKCGMIGKLIEKFVLFNGSGRNGKGVILEQFRAMLGHYGRQSDKDLLTKPTKSGCNPALAALEKKRTAVFSEPESDETVNSGSMKFVTGNLTIPARGLYQKDTEFRNMLMVIMECNTRPRFLGRLDNSVAKRIVDILFTQEFTDDVEEVAKFEHSHLVNKKYKDPMFISESRSAWFNILLEFEMNELYEPECVKMRTKKFLVGTDDLLEWFHETYEYDEDKTQTLKFKDLYNDFKESGLYRNLTKEERRTCWNKMNFTENIQNNVVLRDYCKTIRKVQVITNYKQIC
jgi:phage/plasmid-associated DNA primase